MALSILKKTFTVAHLAKTLAAFYAFLNADNALKNVINEVTTEATKRTLPIDAYQVHFITAGAGTDNVDLPNPATVVPGWRLVLKLKTITAAGGKVLVDKTNLAMGAATLTSVTLDAVGEFVLVEARAAKWEIVDASAGVVVSS